MGELYDKWQAAHTARLQREAVKLEDEICSDYEALEREFLKQLDMGAAQFAGTLAHADAAFQRLHSKYVPEFPKLEANICREQISVYFEGAALVLSPQDEQEQQAIYGPDDEIPF